MEIIDRICYACAVLAGVFRFENQIRGLFHTEVSHTAPRQAIPVPTYSETGGLVFKSEAGVGFPKFRIFVPSQEQLEYFVDASDDDPNIAEASGLGTESRSILYESWHSVNPTYFLVMQRQETFGARWENVALSIILALPRRTFQALKSKKITVVEMRSENLTLAPGETVETLLYDTLIFDPTFRERFSEYKRWHTLFHFSQFTPPADDHQVTILIEPDNPLLKLSLRVNGKYGRHKTFKLRGGHVVNEFILPSRQGETGRVRNFQWFWTKIRAKAWTIPVGTL